MPKEDGYQPNWEGEMSIEDGWVKPFVKTTAKRYSFTVTTRQSDLPLFQDLLNLSNSQYTNNTITPLICQDYCYPEDGITYKERTGLLSELKFSNPTFRNIKRIDNVMTERCYVGEISFTFTELERLFVV